MWNSYSIIIVLPVPAAIKFSPKASLIIAIVFSPVQWLAEHFFTPRDFISETVRSTCSMEGYKTDCLYAIHVITQDA